MKNHLLDIKCGLNVNVVGATTLPVDTDYIQPAPTPIPTPAPTPTTSGTTTTTFNRTLVPEPSAPASQPTNTSSELVSLAAPTAVAQEMPAKRSSGGGGGSTEDKKATASGGINWVKVGGLGLGFFILMGLLSRKK